MHMQTPTLSKHMILFNKKNFLTIARGCKKYSIYSYHICVFDHNNTACYQGNMPKSSHGFYRYIFAQQVCVTQPVISIAGWPKLSFLHRSTNGRALSNMMSIMVLMQELLFHEMEFKLIQSLPLTPAITDSNITSIS